MREKLVVELVKDVLGPRYGVNEILKESPLTEYLTGVLAPSSFFNRTSDLNLSVDSESLEEQIPELGEDEMQEQDVSAPLHTLPPLDPKNRPCSFGISFVVESDGIPRIDFCLTWARYRIEKSDGEVRWIREPRSVVKDNITLDRSQTFYFNISGECSAEEAEISLHVVVAYPGKFHNRCVVNMYFVNRVTVPDDQELTAEYYIFQPQIRVVCDKRTKIVPLEDESYKEYTDTESQELSFLFRNRPVMARGFLCSAVWREIDPQRPFGPPDFPECVKEPPFGWPDGEGLPEKIYKKFSVPDVRSEFVPIYLISFPEMNWPSEYGSPPELNAEILANAFDPGHLRRLLEPITRGYHCWIKEQRKKIKTFPENDQRTAQKLIERCFKVLERMKKGLDILINDPEVRLAFCFANKAMNLQSMWSWGQQLVWRPFQLGYILTVLESISKSDSKEREICDLLWVPTGGGKTEAYLFLILFTAALRRRRAVCRGGSGAGVAVITRYTLRLLTIQQFRRLLTAVTACEYLRVYGLTRSKHVGWTPENFTPPSGQGYIWGMESFSIGLWVGGGVTPNRLRGTWGGNRRIAGALDILKGSQGEGEPAQVTHCPACDSLLAVPEMGISGKQIVHLVVEIRQEKLSKRQILKIEQSLSGLSHGGFIKVKHAKLSPHRTAGFYTLTLELDISGTAKKENIDQLWENINEHMRNSFRMNIELLCACASRPGYFIRWYYDSKKRKQNYDFEIFCPNPDCPLHTPWCAGAPAGWVHGTDPGLHAPTGVPGNIPDATSGYRFIHIQEPFRNGSPFVADRVPIPAYTVDEQIYHRIPSVIVATADKFARPPFEPRASALFGNVDFYHCIWGYYREGAPPLSAGGQGGRPSPAGVPGKPNYVRIRQFDPPELILQDELHLIEGPLGSLVGFYETAVDYLCTCNNRKAKYIASSATVRSASTQVRAVFARNVMIFPPPGLTADDRFFIREKEIHPLDDTGPGRLYVGICAPGRGPLTPLYRIYSSLLQTVYDIYLRNPKNPNIDPFWTLVGYFNAIRELGGARALCRQDIPARLRQIAGNRARPILDEKDKLIDLSSRTPSTDLPAILNLLSIAVPHSPDILLTTSMFGTGIDIPRLSLMVVNGQPKTTSSYIQATGRVGRRKGGLVITFFKASRPRDLSHYEFFCGYHRQLHRFVEPVTIYPFSRGVLDRAAGPVCVFLLRNMKNTSVPWHREDTADTMAGNYSVSEVQNLPHIFENRAQSQPQFIRPGSGDVCRFINTQLDRWRNIAQLCSSNLKYVEYAIDTLPRYNVVLGDAQHVYLGLEVVYENAPTSLRDIEETCGFQT